MSLTEKQLAFRRQGLGGSDIAALVSGRALDVWLEKRGERQFEGNAFTEWGQRNEPAILAKFADAHAVTLLHPRDVWPASVDGTVQHPEHPIALATPDGVVVFDMAGEIGRPVHLVQAKNVGEWTAVKGGWGESGSSDVPTDKFAQVTWEMFVTGVHSATLAALIGGHDYREYPLAYDEELAGLLLETAERFWTDHVIGGTQPAVDGSQAASDYLRARYQHNDGRMLPAPAGAYDLALEYERAREAETEAKARKEELGNRLRELVGEADGLEAPGLKVTWKRQAGMPAYKAIAEQLGATPELIRQHTPTHRVLRVNVKGAE